MIGEPPKARAEPSAGSRAAWEEMATMLGERQAGEAAGKADFFATPSTEEEGRRKENHGRPKEFGLDLCLKEGEVRLYGKARN